MTYHTLIVDPLREMLVKVGSFIPTLVIGLGILIIGCVVAKLIGKAMGTLLSTVGADKLFDKIGVSDMLKKGGVKSKPSELLSTLVYWVFMVIVLIMTVKAFGLTMASALIDEILAYVPGVISGVLVLTLGYLLAKLVSGLVHVVAVNAEIPHPETLCRLSKFAIMVFVAIVFLREVGLGTLFVGEYGMILFTGIVLALAIAFGLGGHEMASKYLDVFKKHDHK